MSTTYKISQLRDLFNDWETGLDQAITLIPLFPIEVINEYWSMGWMQNPANPDDRERSDWIRAILMTYAPEWSLPYEAKFKNRIRHSYSNTYSSNDSVDELFISDSWSHFSDSILHDVIKNLGVTKLEFSGAKVFEKYLAKPTAIFHIKVKIIKDWRNNSKTSTINDGNLAKSIADKIPREIEVLEFYIEDNYDVNFSENSLLDFKNLKVFNFEGNSKSGVLNFKKNNLLNEINIKLKSEEDKLNIKGLNNCLQINKINISSEFKGNINI